ncbi:MAG: iron-sulfur cluster assembly accessory protein [Gammaproteobacteria bacterium]
MSIITFTDAAAGHIKNLLVKDSKGIGFRLSIKKTGCSGYSYVPAIIEQMNEDDIHFVAQSGLHVYVDPECVSFVKDLVIDYVADNVGLKQKRLVFLNPNEKNRCGCGESFTL